MTLFLIISTIYPNGHLLRPTEFERQNIFTVCVQFLYQADTSTNIFPSVHVFNSIVVHIAVVKSSCFKDRPWVAGLSFVIAASICVSTVVLKQHSVVDGFGAMVMAYALYPLVYGEGYASSLRKVTGKALS